MDSVYLDYNATTPIAPEVAEAMQPFLFEHFGNPSSGHRLGQRTRQAVGEARGQVARLLNCTPAEVVFTSGGSESNNMAIKGVAYTYRGKGNHIITSRIEHPAVLNPCGFLEKNGYEVTYLPVDGYGMVDPDSVRTAITPRTILLSIMLANNEVGTIQPIADIGQIARACGILFHTDAAQAVGKIPVDVKALHVDFLSVAGHKLYAPKGVGALYIREGTDIEPLIHGAGHEHGRRAGTENVVLDVALGEAAEIALRRMERDAGHIGGLRDRLHRLLDEKVGGVTLNGHPEKRLPNTLNISFEGILGSELLGEMEGVFASTGSACHDRSGELSGVLAAMEVPQDVGFGAIRFSLGRGNTEAEMEYVADLIADKVRGLRLKGTK